jgi:hypothetical protein
MSSKFNIELPHLRRRNFETELKAVVATNARIDSSQNTTNY